MFKTTTQYVFISLVILLLCCCAACALHSTEKSNAADTQAATTAIKAVLAAQERAWNAADLDGFMHGYWRSDSLVFIGKSGLNKGWQTTLDNYKRSYPTAAEMGTLTFKLERVTVLSPDAAFVIGRWHLARPAVGDLQGAFSLLWRKIDSVWYIVADHSS